MIRFVAGNGVSGLENLKSLSWKLSTSVLGDKFNDLTMNFFELTFFLSLTKADLRLPIFTDSTGMSILEQNHKRNRVGFNSIIS